MDPVVIDIDRVGVQAPLLERVAVALNSTLDLREVLRLLAEAALEETGARRASLFTWQGGRLEPAVALGVRRDETLWSSFRELGPIVPNAEQLEVLAAGRAVVLADPTSSPIVPPGWVERFDLRSAVVVPLLAHGELCGLMAVDYADPDAAVGQDVGLLEAVGGYAGVAIRNARLYEAARRRAGLGEAVARAATALAPPMAPRAVAARLAAALADLLSPRWLGIGLVDGRLIRPLLASGGPMPSEPIRLDDVSDALQARIHDAWASGAPEPVVVDDDPWLARLGPSATRHLVVPLPTGGRPVGIVAAGFDAGTELDAQVLDAVATVAALGGTALERHNLLAQRERQVRQLDVLYRVSTALTERADARVIVARLNELLTTEGVEVVGIAFRDRRLARHLGGDAPTREERAAWGEDDAFCELDDGVWSVPMRIGKRVVGALRIRATDPDPAISSFLELVAAGVGELAMRGALRASLEQAEREKALTAERERIAADLHDTVGRVLAMVTGLGRQLAATLPDEAEPRKRAARIAELADGGKWQLDQAIRALAFVPSSRRGLAASLRGLARQIEDDSGIAVVVEVEGRTARLPGRVEQTLYRVAFEALVNAWRHSRCSLARVRLEFTSGQVILTVIDDGVGLANRTAQPVGGLGLTGMRRLVTDLGGELDLSGGEPHGLAITARVPRGR